MDPHIIGADLMSNESSSTQAEAGATRISDEPSASAGADWESLVVQRIAHHVNAVRQVADDASVFGWESEGLRRLSREVARAKLG